jgi:hypothetical protein
MKSKIGLLVGGLVLLLGTTANATTTAQQQCGSVGSAGNGNVAFTTAANGVAGTASDSSGSGVITCSGFTVPANQTLESITVVVGDDAQQPADITSQVTWMWTYSGQALTPVPSATNNETTQQNGALFSFNSCTGSGTLVCNVAENFSTTTTFTEGQTTGSFIFTVAPSSSGNAGSSESDSAQVFIQFTYGQPGVPEPASLLLVGSGLIGLSVVARRKRQQS